MKPTRWLTLALALATPVGLAAAEDQPSQQNEPQDTSMSDQNKGDDVNANASREADQGTQRSEANRQGTEQPSGTEEHGTTAKSENQKGEKSDQAKADVKAHLVPAIAGIESADKAAAALYELSSAEQINRQDAQRTVQLAQQALNLAYGRTQALGNMKGLSSDARSEVDAAEAKLRDARQTLSQLQKEVGAGTRTEDMKQIQDHAKTLHGDLSDAQKSVDRIAKAYDVSTKLEFGG